VEKSAVDFFGEAQSPSLCFLGAVGEKENGRGAEKK